MPGREVRTPLRKRGASIRLVLSCSLLLLPVLLSIGLPSAFGTTPAYRPDAWLKLCGPRNTCVNQPWHPWHGNNVYNTSGASQTVSSGVEEGNQIRFWILIQNDGSHADTIHVKGCSGTSAFSLLAVNVGAWRFTTGANPITAGFKAGTTSFSFPATSTPKDVIITLRFRVETSSQGVSYTCPVTVSSGAKPTVKDTVIAKMTTI